MKIVAALLLILIVVAVVSGALLLQHGVSARSAPTLTEERIALTMRHFAVPAAMRNKRNPLPLTPQVLADGRAHWADHCALCHANDGSGNTEIGRGLYPKSPDMRKRRTQDLSDGELFAIIRNGVRLTGMPAWGDASSHDDAENWKLVHFIRHLPKLTPEEITQMERLNPKSPDERQEDEFLHGH